MTAFRFKHDRSDLWLQLQQAVDSFKGRVSWSATRVDRNWVIPTTAVRTYAKRSDYSNDVELAIAFYTDYPNVVRAAFDDVPDLAAFIENRLSAAEKDSK